MTSKKRVLIFSTAYLPHIGGAELAVKEITSRLSDYEFVMITAQLDAKLPAEEQIGNVHIYRIGRGNGFDKFHLFFTGVKKAGALGNFDAVWAIMASYAGFAALRYKKRRVSVPFLLTLQEGDSFWHIYKHVWFVWPYFTQIFKKADRIQAISTYLANWAKRLGAACPVDVIPNGLDAHAFRNAFNDAESDTNRTGVRVLSVSRLVKKNGLDVLIRSLRHLPDSYRVAIAGKGEEEMRLRELARRLCVDARVEFLGHVPPEDVPRLYASADVFCRPSHSEGLGNVFLEAFGARLPVVATRVGGIPDIVEHERTGLLCPPGDDACVAASIKRFVEDKKLRERCVGAAYAKVAMYDWSLIADRMRAVFRALV